MHGELQDGFYQQFGDPGYDASPLPTLERNKKGELRSSEQAQLNRACPIVVERFDRTPEAIQSCMMKMYGDIDPDTAREQAKEMEDDELLAEVEECLDM